MRVVGFILLATLVSACQMTQFPTTPSAPPPADAAFDPEQAAFIRKDGKASITGVTLSRNARGWAVRGAGETVTLVPQTDYARKRIYDLYGNAKYVDVIRVAFQAQPDPEYVKYTRSTKADDRGKFSFANVAPGDYFVVTQNAWFDRDNLTWNGNAMYETVTVKAGDSELNPINVVLSGK